MKVLVVGASGATGRLVVDELLRGGREVVIMVRSPEKLPDILKNREGLTIVTGSPIEMDMSALTEMVSECDGVVSCLGHNMTLKGLFGHPRRLVTDAVARICDAIIASNTERPTRFVLMNTAGNSREKMGERQTRGEKIAIGLIRFLLPPHVDNEQAAEHLRVKIGTSHPNIEWVVVRPDSLVNHDTVTEYTAHAAPTRSAIFNPGKTSRINVAHFMAHLILSEELWKKWRGKMPVVYNVEG